jgi:hypothetical protein
LRFGSVEIGVIWVSPNAGCSSGFLRLIFKVTTPDRRSAPAPGRHEQPHWYSPQRLIIVAVGLFLVVSGVVNIIAE